MYFNSCTKTNVLNAYIQTQKPGDHYFISKSKHSNTKIKFKSYPENVRRKYTRKYDFKVFKSNLI